MAGQSAPRASERRKERRVDAEVSVTLASPTGEPLAAATQNLSGSGAYIILDEPLPLFARYHVHLLLPGIDEEGADTVEDIELIAIVVRHDPIRDPQTGTRHCMALFFDGVPSQARERIIEFVDAQYD